MRFLYFLFISIFTSSFAFAETQFDYVLKAVKVLENECRIAVFIDKNSTNFIVKEFSRHSLIKFNKEFMPTKEVILTADENKTGLLETLEMETKNHLFSIDNEGYVSLKYSFQDDNGELVQKEITFEKKYCVE